jgi:hypothetical protein
MTQGQRSESVNEAGKWPEIASAHQETDPAQDQGASLIYPRNGLKRDRREANDTHERRGNRSAQSKQVKHGKAQSSKREHAADQQRFAPRSDTLLSRAGLGEDLEAKSCVGRRRFD